MFATYQDIGFAIITQPYYLYDPIACNITNFAWYLLLPLTTLWTSCNCLPAALGSSVSNPLCMYDVTVAMTLVHVTM